MKFLIPVETLAFHGAARERVVEPGRVIVRIGRSSADIHLHGEFTITGSTRVIPSMRNYFTRSE